MGVDHCTRHTESLIWSGLFTLYLYERGKFDQRLALTPILCSYDHLLSVVVDKYTRF